MPVVFIEKKLLERITTAIDDAYHIGDTLMALKKIASGG
jgi:hypothetical protein